MIRRDFHTHSIASDGVLTPAELIAAAAAEDVAELALTDHDTVAGLAAARQAAQAAGLSLIPGVEISVTWDKRLLHIVGLGVDAGAPGLADGLAALQRTRAHRGGAIARRLEQHGLVGAAEGVRQLSRGAEPTRTHFARWLVATGAARTGQQAFRRWLAPGRPGYVGTSWAGLEEACDWIRGAGGVPVVAHPGRYKLTRVRMARLLDEFRAHGGQALEVVRAGADPREIQDLADWARRFDLAGSVGSDFHEPGRSWQRLGRLAKLPTRVRPVWHQLDTGSAATGGHD
jgi:predicted metal-dependent phosphoesterase TrpH